MTSPPTDPYAQWTSLSDGDLMATQIKNILGNIEDEYWVVAACVDRIGCNSDVQRSLLELGIARTEAAVERTETVFAHPLPPEDDEEVEILEQVHEEDLKHKALIAHFSDSIDGQLCRLRAILLDRLDRLRTYEEIFGETIEDPVEGNYAPQEDDPWATSGDGPAENLEDTTTNSSSVPMYLPLSVCLTESLTLLCYSLAARRLFAALQCVMERHHSQVFPYRFQILQRIPLFAALTDYRHLLPAANVDSGNEVPWRGKPWRPVSDFTETHNVKKALREANLGNDLREQDDEDRLIDMPRPSLLTAEELRKWYTERAEETVRVSGNVDDSLDLVQHAISLGVAGLDEVGEDLTLLSRLVYDAPSSDADETTLTLASWRSLEPSAVVRLYLGKSTPDSIVNDIRRLILPYLFILESRAERASKPDSGLYKRLMYNYILTAPLSLVGPIFDASKPTVVMSRRLVRDDEDLARLALSCLYGSESVDEWADMSRLFECLPAWTFVTNTGDDDAEATIASLKELLTPSTNRPKSDPLSLLSFFTPLPARSLSHLLDILDVHLESGEVLARWNVPVPLRWFLQSAHDEAQQRAWATKMSRQAGALAEDLLAEDDWLALLDDMLKLARGDSSPNYSAFGALSRREINQIFFGGLLSSGKFTVANRLVSSRGLDLLLSAEDIERICLETSREYYDNASSGNFNFGAMHLAYECLSVASPSPAIQREREFIEATSRISSFNVMSRPGVAMLPIEIRLVKDKLSLISRVLSSNETAYRHTEVILELVHKLGFRGDVRAEVKTLAMIADTALQTEDYPRAFEASERLIDTVLKFRASSPLGQENPSVSEAIDVCWVSCFQLGRQAASEDVVRSMILLGRALELCPTEKIVDILIAWRKLETLSMEKHTEHRSAISQTPTTKHRRGMQSTASSLTAKLHELHMPSPKLPQTPDAAALASQAFSRVAANFPFSVRGRASDGQGGTTAQRTGSPDMQQQARHALQRGIGWLIGADEDEL